MKTLFGWGGRKSKIERFFSREYKYQTNPYSNRMTEMIETQGSRKEVRMMVRAIGGALRSQDLWRTSYDLLRVRKVSMNEDEKEQVHRRLKTSQIVYNMLASTYNNDIKNDTYNTPLLLRKLVQTNWDDLEVIIALSTTYLKFDESLDALEERKETLTSQEYVIKSDTLKYLYDLNKKYFEN